MTSLLSLRNLTKRYSGLTAVDNVSLDISAGSVVGLIGPNGAGKTSLVNLISGSERPTEGSILLDGVGVQRLSPEQRSRAGLARTFQIARVFPGLTLLENVKAAVMFGATRERGRHAAKARAEELLEYTGLIDEQHRLAGEVNLPSQKRLQIARCLATSPRLLMLDEAMAGLNHQEVDEALVLLRAIRDEGVSLIVIEHLMRVVMNLCDRIVVLSQGRILADGTAVEVTQNDDVISLYLGDRYVRRTRGTNADS